jgi:D-alanyl-lipoteichoic acid acyltransferase DltB (MBOAT superfamily)
MIFFTFQIYCDFSGYSDIAIGTARLFGIKLNRNFNVPYISSNFTEFWKRWHISLSSWFRDYVYISLGGNRVGKIKNYRNLITTFIVSGLWHGANYTFIVWGAIHGILLILEKSLLDLKIKMTLNKYLKIASTFFITNITWVFFRSKDVNQALTILSNSIKINTDLNSIVFSFRGLGIDFFELITMFLLIALVVIIESFESYFKSIKKIQLPYIQFIWIQILIFFILFFATKGELKNFIYFQF